MKPIFIIGFMGSGKSTLGRALAQATGLTFIDLDTYIAQRFHANVRDIFAQRGEDGFRRLERMMLHEVSEFEDVIVACGGGTPCFFNNMEHINSHGTSVFLEASHDSLLRRLKQGRRRRPLIAAMTDDELDSYISEALDRRLPYYTLASHRFCGDRLDSVQQIADSVSEFVNRFNLNVTLP